MTNAFALKVARTVGLGLTQEQMARELRVSLRTLTRWEKAGPPERAWKHIELLLQINQRAKSPVLCSVESSPASVSEPPRGNLVRLIELLSPHQTSSIAASP